MNFINARVVDQASGSNILSDDLTETEKIKISVAAILSRSHPTWQGIV